MLCRLRDAICSLLSRWSISPATTRWCYHIVSGSITGSYHSAAGVEGEDRYTNLALEDGTQLLIVADGAGGRKNGARAAQQALDTVSQHLQSSPISLMLDDDATLRRKLDELVCVGHNAAREVQGRTTILLFMYRPGHNRWVCMKVGDPVLLFKLHDRWWLPLPPSKMCWGRNVTELLGQKDALQGTRDIYIGDLPPDLFLLMSDWACGDGENAPVRDTTPDAILGSYEPNQGAIERLVSPLIGFDITSNKVERYLEALRLGQVPGILRSNDDLTLVLGQLLK